ncbi:CU044_5270 family protein [Actinomadura gamaensis]|uniref:CU044_5270 family protein n=1 Tax=Actinomadura gamaensis TaxID=1763541 RepID=A0ABV9TRK8_9ACTN
MNDLDALRAAWEAPAPPSPEARANARAALLSRATASAVAPTPTPILALPSDPAAPRVERASAVVGGEGGTSGGARRSRRRWGWSLAAVGAAAAIGAGFAVAPSGTGGDGHRNGGVRLMSANALLDRAADAAERRPFTAPRPDQWVMVEERLTTSAEPAGVVTGGPYMTRVRRTWHKADGSLMAYWVAPKGKVQVQSAAGMDPRVDYAAMSRLPTDPDALIARVRRDAPGQSWDRVLQLLNTILRTSTPPPKVQAAIFRAMRSIPGGTLVNGVRDAAGRPAIAIGWTTEGWLREEVLLDPKSYAYLGERAVAGQRHEMESAKGTVVVPKGAVQRVELRTRAGVVDAPGLLPR